MRAFIGFFLRQKVLVNLLFLLLMVLGAVALLELPVERYPNVNIGKVMITTFLPGASPRDVEALVTREIEDALDDLEDVEFIRSTSYRGRSSIIVKFIDDSDYARLSRELRLKVLGALPNLPELAEPPIFKDVDVSYWLPVITVNLAGDRDNHALKLMADELKLGLEEIDGVKNVEITGAETREFHIFIDPVRLEHLGLTYEDVAGALKGANLTLPAGTFKNRDGEFVVIVDQLFRSRADVEKVIIRRDGDGSFVRLGEVLTAAGFAYREPLYLSSVNGRPSVGLKIVKNDHGNVLKIVAAVKAVIARFQTRLDREGVDVILTQDQRIHLNDAIRTLGFNLVCGIVLVSFSVWLFMGWRNALLATVGIPFSFLCTMTIMYVTGNSLNEITLFAFVLVSGIIVDDAIVVLENIYRRLQEGEELYLAALNGTAEVAWPVVAATSTTIAAFLPMLIMSGSTGEFFAFIPKAVSFALTASLFECLVILPSHFTDWPGARSLLKSRYVGSGRERKLMVWLRRLTDSLVAFTLRFRRLTLAGVLVLFGASVAVLYLSISGISPLIKVKFFPDDYTLYYVEFIGPPATPVRKTREYLENASRLLLAGGPGQLRSVMAQAGFYINEDYQPVWGANVGHLAVTLPARDRRDFPDNPDNDPMRFLDYVRRMVKPLAKGGWQVRVRPEKFGPPTGKDINVRVVGSDERVIERLAAAFRDFLSRDPRLGKALTALSSNQGEPSRIYRFRVDRRRAAEYNLTEAQVAILAGSILDGRYVGKFRARDEDLDMKLKIDPGFLKEPADALKIPVQAGPGGGLKLGDLVKVASYLEPGYLNRFNSRRAITLTANLKASSRLSVPAAIRIIRDFYAGIAADYPGAEVVFGGEFESTRRSYTSLAYAFIIAILAIYIILALQFQSYVQPVIILSAVAFALIGVVIGKLVTQDLFTINSFIAVVGVTGVVVNDSLVLIDFINRAYAASGDRRQAIREGIRVRLRPIILTTLTTTLGLLPMAIGFPYYSLVWGTMASTFVTGLCTATFLTLFIVPLEWDLLARIQERAEPRCPKGEV
ncbi:MAG: efflux RND transporter permease subunit [Deltaproteobacteria bacterium]|nr:efflux RND transporter permease subunit [Deltaproteobacteria bacterium]